MEARKHGKLASNAGLSLMELVVTLLISGVVMLAATGFLTAGLRYYRNVNSESLLQMESQMTELFLTELIQESSDFTTVRKADYPSGVEVKYALEVVRGGKTYMVAWLGNELYYSEVTGATITERLKCLTNKDRSDTFLAQYVTSFSLDPFAQDFKSAQSNMYRGTMINISYEVDQKKYEGSSLIMLRNVERN